MTTKTYTGLYKIPEATRYLYVTSHLPSNYAKPTPSHLALWMKHGILASHLTNISGRGATIDFEDLVSMRVIYFLRGMGISMQKIKKAKKYLEKITNHSHPFATEKLWTETFDIFAEIGSMLVTASQSGQLPFMDLVERDLVNIHDMTFRQGVADSWSPQDGVLLKPNIQFGAPCIINTGIPTHSIWRMYLGGDDVNFLAQSYGIEKEQINRALDWEDSLAKITFTRPTKTSNISN
ncbi:DUF433 domain-containing protein [Chloroflexota bacterium]